MAGHHANGSYDGRESYGDGPTIDACEGEIVGVALTRAGDDTRVREVRPCQRSNRSDFSRHPVLACEANGLRRRGHTGAAWRP